MLSAFNSEKELVLAEDSQKLDKYTCPECNEVLSLRIGSWKIPHFSHKKDPEKKICERGKSESKEHETTKLKIYKDAISYMKEKGKIRNVSIEYRIGKRIADVAIIGAVRKIAVEVQHSPISKTEIIERMQDHYREGFSTLWVVFPGSKIESTKKSGLLHKVRSFHKDIHNCTKGTILVYDGDLYFSVFHLMGYRYKTFKNFKKLEKIFHIFELDDIIIEKPLYLHTGGVSSTYRYKVVGPRYSSRWWETNGYNVTIDNKDDGVEDIWGDIHSDPKSQLEVLYVSGNYKQARVKLGHRYQDISMHPYENDSKINFEFLKHFGDGDIDSGTTITIDLDPNDIYDASHVLPTLLCAICSFYKWGNIPKIVRMICDQKTYESIVPIVPNDFASVLSMEEMMDNPLTEKSMEVTIRYVTRLIEKSRER